MTNEFPLTPELAWVHSAHMRDTHDLWHAATGYAGDVLGETALLGFTFRAGRGILRSASSLAIGIVEDHGGAERRRGGRVARSWTGLRRGKKAAWLPEQEVGDDASRCRSKESSAAPLARSAAGLHRDPERRAQGGR